MRKYGFRSLVQRCLKAAKPTRNFGIREWWFTDI